MSVLELLRIEDEVNLERAMKANDRLGGHFVQVREVAYNDSTI